MRKKRLELVEDEPADLLAYADAPPEARVRLQLGAQSRQADEHDLHTAALLETALGESTRLSEGLAREVVRFVEPEEELLRLAGQRAHESLEGHGVAHAGAHAQALADDLDEPCGPQAPGL